MADENTEEQPERSTLDSRAFIFAGVRVTDLQPVEHAVEILGRRDKTTTLPA